MRFFKWLSPGLGIKRWIFLCLSGLGLVVVFALLTVKSLSRESVLLASVTMSSLIFGIFLIYMGIKNMVRIFVRALMPLDRRDSELVDIVFQSQQSHTLLKGPRVVAIGGGTGLSAMLSGIKKYTSNITAIVTVTDTGGSSGRLRDEMDILPPGDIRNCLVSLADAGPLIRDLFQYRFEVGEGLKGHSFGNLFITALSKVTGDFEKAIAESSKVLNIRGRVLPSTLEKVSLVAEFSDGTWAEGETNITDFKKNIVGLKLKPADCRACAEAVDAILNADIILMGPGSLYTSILPNLLIPEIQKAILKSDAYKIYVMNVMTQPGETIHYSASDHLDVLTRHTDPRIVDGCFVNTRPVPPDLLKKYAEQGAELVDLDLEKIEAKGYEILKGSVITTDGQVRHDSEKLCQILIDHASARLSAGAPK